LNLGGNDLHGFLPAHIGSPSCLPNLKALSVYNNENLGGVIDRGFLMRGEVCEAFGCHWSMRLPFISGASLSSADLSSIYLQLCAKGDAEPAEAAG
jgi:hypothetical protein